MNQTTSPKSLPEDEDMDPVGETYPKQRESTVRTIPEDGDDPPHPPFSPDREADIPQDSEFERIVQHEQPND